VHVEPAHGAQQRIGCNDPVALRQKIAVRAGIPKDKSKPLIDAIKSSKLKVQAQYQDEQIRISGKSKDDLQKVQQLLKTMSFELPLQFVNYR